MRSPDVVDALNRAAHVGPYFEMTVLEDVEGWRPFGELLGDPARVAERVRGVRATLAQRVRADVELRVAASLHLLALASRIVSPALASAALTGVVPTWNTQRLWWQPVDGGPVPLAVTQPGGVAVGSIADARQALYDSLIGPLAPLVAAFARVDGVGVAPRVLWGNVASALAGATRLLLDGAEPMQLDPRAIVSAVLTQGPLAGAGGFGRDGRFFRRASCCLFYRVPGGGYCGDCVLG